jgi:hypothetical protein
MKNRIILLLIIIIIASIAACAPVTKTANESVGTPSVVLATNTATHTDAPTEIQVPTRTKTLEPTATPTAEVTPTLGIVRPTKSIDELIPEGSPLREAGFYQAMKTQFENGGLQLENDKYHLFCISSQDMYRHEPFIELHDGSIVTHSIPCQYFDAEGSEQLVFIPAVRFKEDEKLYQFLGFKPVVDNPIYDEVWELTSYGAAKDIGPISFLHEHGYTGAGHPFTLHFGLVEPDQIQAFASQVQAEIQANPEDFAGSGDPADLYQQLLFPWIQVGFRNNFVRYVE